MSVGTRGRTRRNDGSIVLLWFSTYSFSPSTKAWMIAACSTPPVNSQCRARRGMSSMRTVMSLLVLTLPAPGPKYSAGGCDIRQDRLGMVFHFGITEAAHDG